MLSFTSQFFDTLCSAITTYIIPYWPWNYVLWILSQLLIFVTFLFIFNLVRLDTIFRWFGYFIIFMVISTPIFRYICIRVMIIIYFKSICFFFLILLILLSWAWAIRIWESAYVFIRILFFLLGTWNKRLRFSIQRGWLFNWLYFIITGYLDGIGYFLISFLVRLTLLEWLNDIIFFVNQVFAFFFWFFIRTRLIGWFRIISIFILFDSSIR